MRFSFSFIAVISCVGIFGVFPPAIASTFEFGDATTFNASTYLPFGSRIDDSHILLAYSDSGSGTVMIGTLDGTDMTFGSEYRFGEGAVSNISSVMLNSTRAFITYTVSGTGYGIIATISGTTVTFGSPVSFDTDVRDGGLEIISVTALDATHVAVAYITNREDLESNVIVATVSGSSITFGTSEELSNNAGQYIAIAAMDSTHFLLFQQEDDGTGYLRAVSISGTSMTLGSPIGISGYGSDPSISPLSSTRAIIAYRSPDDDRSYAHIASFSGLSVSVGSAYAVTTARTYYPTVAALNATNLVLLYADPDNLMEWYATRVRVTSDTVSGDAAELALAEWGSQYRHVIKLTTGTAIFIMENKAVVATTDTVSTAAPSMFNATVTSNTVSLSWTNPVDADFSWTSLRRSTGGYPASSTEGTHVASGSALSSYSDTGLADGTYYYALFAFDESRNVSDAAQVTARISTASSSSSAADTIQRGGGRRGSPGRGNISSPRMTVVPSLSPEAPKESMSNDMRAHTCTRVMKWFRGNDTMLHRVNKRLQQRFGFACAM